MAPKSPESIITLVCIHSIIIFTISNIWVSYGFNFTNSDPNCLMYNFGDSNTDAGSSSVLLGMDLSPPFGQNFFQETVGRYSDGRVYLDYICEGLGRDYLSPFPEPFGSNFSSGANFAIAGATVAPIPGVTFTLRTQVDQFGHFQKRIQKFRHKGKAPMISDDDVKNAVYLMDIGQNDLHNKFLNNSSFRTVIEGIPLSITTIEAGIKALYNLAGARKFLISNIGPMGCLPMYVAMAKMYNITQVDKLGCVSMYNFAVKNYNNQLRVLLDRLRSEYKDTNIVHVDMYKIKHSLFAKPRQYGFENPLTQCCVSCSLPWGTVCPNPSKSVVWDEVHFTDAAHKVIASKVLSGNYSNPRVTLETLCKFRSSNVNEYANVTSTVSVKGSEAGPLNSLHSFKLI